jgi:NADPH2:quinone reductase
MRTAFITESGPLEAIQVDELPVPGPKDVLFAVEVSAVNPADTLECTRGDSFFFPY